MKEIESEPGDHITRACERLSAEAPAFLVFNDVRIESRPGDSAGDLVAYYHREMERLAAESDARRKAHEATPEGQRELAESRARQKREEEAHKLAVTRLMASGIWEKYPFPEGARELSGFGGGYEQACRRMMYAAILWFEENPSAPEPDFGSFGSPENESAKALDAFILSVEPGCSGAMYGVALNHARFVHVSGWAKYVESMTTRATDSADA